MSNSPSDFEPLQAADVFGGAAALAERIAVMIKVTREARGYSQDDLAVKAQEGSAVEIADLESQKKLPTKAALMAYLDALNLPIQNVMPIESLDDAAQAKWGHEMLRRKVALMAQNNGVDVAQVSTPEHKRWALELFLRIEALTEVCAPAQTKPDMEGRAKRLRAALAEV